MTLIDIPQHVAFIAFIQLYFIRKQWQAYRFSKRIIANDR